MIGMVLFTLILLVSVFGAIDAASRPFDHWQQIGRSKAVWIFLQLLAFVPILDLLAATAAGAYLIGIRPNLKSVAEQLPTL